MAEHKGAVASASREVYEYASRLASEIQGGDAPQFVKWNGRAKIHVIIRSAFPPERLPPSLSLDQWRSILSSILDAELKKRGWLPVGGNRYRRQGTPVGGPAQASAGTGVLSRPAVAHARKLAYDIRQGGGPPYVRWSGREEVHVAIDMARPSKALPAGLSLEQWRKEVGAHLAERLTANGWVDKGGGRFRWQAAEPRGQSRRHPHDAARAWSSSGGGKLIWGILLLLLAFVVAQSGGGEGASGAFAGILLVVGGALAYIGYRRVRPVRSKSVRFSPAATRWELGVNEMSPTDFERHVAGLLRCGGWHVRLTPVTGDGGVDIVARKGNRHAVVQCKRWEDPVGEREVRDLFGAQSHAKASEAILVTTSRFTEPARSFAAANNITLVDGSNLERLMLDLPPCRLNRPGFSGGSVT